MPVEVRQGSTAMRLEPSDRRLVQILTRMSLRILEAASPEDSGAPLERVDADSGRA
jgi:hypothetical protein